MSKIYSKYLGLNESDINNKKHIKKNVRKPLKESYANDFDKASDLLSQITKHIQSKGFRVRDTDLDEEDADDYIDYNATITLMDEMTEEEFKEIVVKYLEEEHNIFDPELYYGKIITIHLGSRENLEESRKSKIFKNKKKLSEKSKKKPIKEWRRNISGHSEISDKEVEKYQSELDEIGGKLEKAGISVKKIGQVNVEEVEGSDDYFTEEAWGHIELSKPVKDEEEFEKICDIVEPYIDNRLSDVKDIGYVGSEDLHITFKVVDRFWDNEELEESSRKKSRFSKKRLSEKDSKTFNKAFKDFENIKESIKNRKNIMFKKVALKESRMKRKYLKESDKYWEAYEQAKKIIQDSNIPEVYVDDVLEHSEFFVFVLGSNEKDKKKVIDEASKKISSTFLDNKDKYPLIDNVTPPFGKDDLSITFFIKEEAFLKDFKESKKLNRFNSRTLENTKRKSLKEFKKLKESRKKLSKRKLNESDSATIKINFTNYRECLRCIFKDMNENLQSDQLDWYTELGMEMSIDPNSMYEWIRNEVELLSVEEIKEYKDLGDVSDEEAIDFAREKGYYEGEVNGDTYFLVPLGE